MKEQSEEKPEPQLPEGFHYHGSSPHMHNGKVSIRVRRDAGEIRKTYADCFIVQDLTAVVPKFVCTLVGCDGTKVFSLARNI